MNSRSGLAGASIRVRIDELGLPPGEACPAAFAERLGRSLAALRDGDQAITPDAVAAAVATALDGTTAEVPR